MRIALCTYTTLSSFFAPFFFVLVSSRLNISLSHYIVVITYAKKLFKNVIRRQRSRWSPLPWRHRCCSRLFCFPFICNYLYILVRKVHYDFEFLPCLLTALAHKHNELTRNIQCSIVSNRCELCMISCKINKNQTHTNRLTNSVGARGRYDFFRFQFLHIVRFYLLFRSRKPFVSYFTKIEKKNNSNDQSIYCRRKHPVCGCAKAAEKRLW